MASAAASLSPLALKVPAIRRTGNTKADYMAELERQDLVDAVDILVKHPSLRGDALRFLRGRLNDTDEDAVDAFKNIKCLGSLEESWVVGFLCDQSKLTPADIGRMKSQDADIVKHLFAMLLFVTPACKIPPVCASKPIMYKTCVSRAKAVGDRLSSVGVGAGILANGKVAWGTIGVYGVVFEAETPGVASKILHRPTGDEASVKDQGVGADWQLINNWSDMQAQVVKGHAKFKLGDCFGKHSGPHKQKIWCGACENFTKTASDAADAHAVVEKMAKEGALDIDESSFDDGSKEKMRLASKRAREALVRANEAKKARRTIVLTAASVT